MDLNIELRDMVLINNYDFGETPYNKNCREYKIRNYPDKFFNSIFMKTWIR